VQARDVAFLLNGHVHLVAPTGADGSHVDGPIRGLRKKLPGDAILGAGCGLSRHDAMVAGEAGADYVAFGPWGPDAAEHLAWWQETMELPCVALGLPDPLSAQAAARSGADFVVLGDAVWDCERGAASAVSSLTAAIAKATSH
jgi:thiamine-phosphate pyrophosphorylase